jgi:beta-lactamase superfamily II metal-dependent hydrolase
MLKSRMAKSGTNLQADILKVGYHGSATSSSSAFLSKAQPKISVIEVGAGNSYGPPTPATLGRLAKVGSAVYRTDLNGDIIVTTDGSTYDVKTGQTSCQPVSGSANTVTTQKTLSTQSSAGEVSPV